MSLERNNGSILRRLEPGADVYSTERRAGTQSPPLLRNGSTGFGAVCRLTPAC